MIFFISTGILIFLVLMMLLFIYISPGIRRNFPEEGDWIKNKPIAHRGLHTDDSTVPENSMAAFKKAVDKGYGIELDVHITSDGEIIVHHDYNLVRMTGFKGLVRETPWNAIKELSLLDSDEKVPLLKDVLDMVDGRVPILIEVKNEGKVGYLEENLIKLLNNYTGEFAVQSFNPFVIKYFKENAPRIIRGQLAGKFKGEKLAAYKKFLLKNLMLNIVGNPQFIAYEINQMPSWMAKRIKSRNVPILAWTAKSMEDYNTALCVSDNVIFEGFEPKVYK